tara:strand:- start:617 stop:1276 length:660 start_codon:yes stop_codon:yes gene_type:complete
MKSEIFKRIVSSIIIMIIFLFCYLSHKYIWLLFVSVCCLLIWKEWINIVKKIRFKNKNFKILCLILFVPYLIFSWLTFYLGHSEKYVFISLILICISSDIGGYVFGKTIGGKKLTKISPNKTFAGAAGSFIFSIIVFFIIFDFNEDFSVFNKDLNYVWVTPIIISFINQLGDLFISFFKRMAKIKNTSNLIPGHGGLLDRLDGIIFAYPLSLVVLSFVL